MFTREPLYILIYFVGSALVLVSAGSKDDSNLGKCPPLMFECDNTQCIPRSWRCDGDTDCHNGKDEMDCPKVDDECDEQHFKCKAPTSKESGTPLGWRSLSQMFPASCIPLAWKCDGEFDCPEKDDEDKCRDVTCGGEQFKCKGFLHNLPTCIPKSWVCDGQADCSDHEDEKNCNSTSPDRCKDDEFTCDDGQCIFKSWECDGEFDCKDKSDEAKCNTTVCDPQSHFKCETSHFCLPIKWKCDGQPDCPDHSDEKNCTEFKPDHVIECSDSEIQCMNKAESMEVMKPTVMKGRGKICVAKKNYKCNNNTCIPYEQLCSDNSSRYDCLDSVCGKKITQCNEASDYCHCRDTYARGTVCYCLKGFELQGGNCVDIDECKQDGICDQKCTNLAGTYSCDCYHGFKLTGGEATESGTKRLSKCRAIGSDPLILLSNRAAIRQYDLVTNKYRPLVNKLESAVAMDYWHLNKTLIWSDVFKEQIMMCTLKGTEEDNFHECAESAITLIDKNISTPDGLAVDWIHGLLFWTDTGLDTISVYDLNTKKRKVLFNSGLEEPRAIAVDPSAGLIFWTDWGSRGRIERAGMDGSNRAEILGGDDVRWPNGLALDIYDQRVYWADAKTKAISSCDYWGKGVKTILHSHKFLKHPFSLAVFEERLYWTDWDNEGVLSINKFNGGDVKVVMNGVPGPMTVRVYHEMAQPNHTNKCEMHTCEHICLPRAHIGSTDQDGEYGVLQGLPFKCACETGYRLSIANTFSCIAEGLLGGSVVQELNEAGNSGNAVFTLFILGLIVAAVLLLGYTYRQRKFNRFTALNFDNPVYRRTVEDVDGELEVFGDNTVGAIPVNPAASQEPRLVLSNEVASQYSRDQAAYMDNDPINHRGLY
ncbi:hypothetical protein FO519_007686 [Halicephalobus sp. NKZ332]|nr:hypothetical protein FO519_007686 [Halicephalobus sp. NKZ332]